ncbi:MAG: DUF1772 domain-containing protein [Acidimicrobiia bacterium]|nr:DUF1772 domain-containing protein [Acidimicrobiia bacterium]NNL69776.1 DUF1772 domain-containing protein [Acidimicrobiia bacterium]
MSRRDSVDVVNVTVIAAALLCGLVTGFLFGFVVVAMPGLGTLEDHDFLRGFAVMDRVIQDRQPLFMVMWAGSVVAVLATAVLGIFELEGADRLLAEMAAAVYLLGVQAPTAMVNIPLNDAVQALDLDSLSPPSLLKARKDFERRWNRWNAVRTAFGAVATVLLLVLLLRLDG